MKTKIADGGGGSVITKGGVAPLAALCLALFAVTPLCAHLRATARPPPGPLPPLNTKPEFTVQRFLAPIVLLFLALLIPARTRLQRRIVAGLFAPAILRVHWGSLSCGSRSSAHGFALGVYILFHTYQTLDLLLFSCPRTTFFRVPVDVQRQHALTRQPNIPASCLDPYPAACLSRRIHWVFELITTMRYVGWHTPHSKPTTSPHLLRSCAPPTLSRSRFVRTLLLRILVLGLIVDFLVWNIRMNDTGFHLPYLLLQASTPHAPQSAPPSQISFDPSFPAIAIYPTPPLLHLSRSPPWLTISLEPNPSYRLLPHQIPLPKYTLLPAPTPTSAYIYKAYIFPLCLAFTRTLLQTLALYAAMSGVFSLACLALMLLSYLIYPPNATTSHRLLAQSRWFSPAAYPHLFSFSEIELQRPPGVGEFWAKTWHALFRRGFLRPWVASRAPRWAALVGVFALSGLLHYWGIRTKVDGDVRGGGWGCLLFFLIQPLGIAIEMAARGLWSKFTGPTRRGMAMRVAEAAVAWAWVLGWFAWTSPWFFDELAWIGVWRVEAAPVSLWQEGWWRWGAARDEGGEWGWWEWSDGGRGWGIVI
ncbi:hypothetical protein EV426DRAFT_715257 [Tirmania nivea]|nr:hypothetical protein EV426DRAFT_715257 [Tirmania nivea]